MKSGRKNLALGTRRLGFWLSIPPLTGHLMMDKAPDLTIAHPVLTYGCSEIAPTTGWTTVLLQVHWCSVS